MIASRKTSGYLRNIYVNTHACTRACVREYVRNFTHTHTKEESGRMDWINLAHNWVETEERLNTIKFTFHKSRKFLE